MSLHFPFVTLSAAKGLTLRARCFASLSMTTNNL